jgi:pimeloyl-ACP methyl ester carboxylesterase
MQGREAIEPMARAMAEEMLPATPEGLVGLMRTLVSAPDEAVLGDELGAYWSAGMPEVFRQGAVGWVDDDITFVEPWGFDPADISLPTLVWHGRHDLFVPVAHGEWLARTIPGAEARITIDDGHLTLIANRVPAVHEWLLARF